MKKSIMNKSFMNKFLRRKTETKAVSWITLGSMATVWITLATVMATVMMMSFMAPAVRAVPPAGAVAIEIPDDNNPPNLVPPAQSAGSGQNGVGVDEPDSMWNSQGAGPQLLNSQPVSLPSFNMPPSPLIPSPPIPSQPSHPSSLSLNPGLLPLSGASGSSPHFYHPNLSGIGVTPFVPFDSLSLTNLAGMARAGFRINPPNGSTSNSGSGAGAGSAAVAGAAGPGAPAPPFQRSQTVLPRIVINGPVDPSSSAAGAAGAGAAPGASAAGHPPLGTAAATGSGTGSSTGAGAVGSAGPGAGGSAAATSSAPGSGSGAAIGSAGAAGPSSSAAGAAGPGTGGAVDAAGSAAGAGPGVGSGIGFGAGPGAAPGAGAAGLPPLGAAAPGTGGAVGAAGSAAATGSATGSGAGGSAPGAAPDPVAPLPPPAASRITRTDSGSPAIQDPQQTQAILRHLENNHDVTLEDFTSSLNLHYGRGADRFTTLDPKEVQTLIDGQSTHIIVNSLANRSTATATHLAMASAHANGIPIKKALVEYFAILSNADNSLGDAQARQNIALGFTATFKGPNIPIQQLDQNHQYLVNACEAYGNSGNPKDYTECAKSYYNEWHKKKVQNPAIEQLPSYQKVMATILLLVQKSETWATAVNQQKQTNPPNQQQNSPLEVAAAEEGAAMAAHRAFLEAYGNYYRGNPQSVQLPADSTVITTSPVGAIKAADHLAGTINNTLIPPAGCNGTGVGGPPVPAPGLPPGLPHDPQLQPPFQPPAGSGAGTTTDTTAAGLPPSTHTAGSPPAPAPLNVEVLKEVRKMYESDMQNRKGLLSRLGYNSTETEEVGRNLAALTKLLEQIKKHEHPDIGILNKQIERLKRNLHFRNTNDDYRYTIPIEKQHAKITEETRILRGLELLHQQLQQRQQPQSQHPQGGQPPGNSVPPPAAGSGAGTAPPQP